MNERPHREVFAEANEGLKQAQTEDQLERAQVEKDMLLANANEDAIIEDKDFEYAKKERRHIAEEEVLASLREKGYLDTFSDGMEVHQLTIRPLTREEAIDEIRKKAETDAVGWNLGINNCVLDPEVPYITPKAENINVVIINKKIDNGYTSKYYAVKEMNDAGLRPLTYEELIQYGLIYTEPKHPNGKNEERTKTLIALGTEVVPGGVTGDIVHVPELPKRKGPYSPPFICLNFWADEWGDDERFLFAIK